MTLARAASCLLLAGLSALLLAGCPSTARVVPARVEADGSVCGKRGPIDASIRDCARLEGSSYQTQRGVRFLRVASSGGVDQIWKDSASGIVWYPPSTGTYSWDEAKAHCAHHGLALPSAEEFKQAEANGLGEVMRDSLTGYWYWTATPSPGLNFGTLAQAYQGLPHGYVVNLYRHDRISARCVGR